MESSIDRVVDGAEDCDPAKHSNIPIHRLRCNGRRCWEEAEYEESDQEDKRDEIYRKSPAAKRKLCLWKRLASQTFEENTTDREDIG